MVRARVSASLMIRSMNRPRVSESTSMITVLMAMPTNSSPVRGLCQRRASPIPTTARITATAARLRGRIAQVCGKSPKLRIHAVPVPSNDIRTIISPHARAT